MLLEHLLDDCLKIFYLQPDFYKNFMFEWLSMGYLKRINSLVKTMCFWIDKLSDINTYIQPFDEKGGINEMLQEFNKAVINEIENYRLKFEKTKSTNISFNEAAMIWIEKDYKNFKEQWFEKHCEHYCKKICLDANL